MSDMPEHVDVSARGHVCKHCGGAVDEEGFSIGGLVEADTGEYEPFESPDDESRETEQHEDVEQKRSAAFASAVTRSKRG